MSLIAFLATANVLASGCTTPFYSAASHSCGGKSLNLSAFHGSLEEHKLPSSQPTNDSACLFASDDTSEMVLVSNFFDKSSADSADIYENYSSENYRRVSMPESTMVALEPKYGEEEHSTVTLSCQEDDTYWGVVVASPSFQESLAGLDNLAESLGCNYQPPVAVASG